MQVQNYNPRSKIDNAKFGKRKCKCRIKITNNQNERQLESVKQIDYEMINPIRSNFNEKLS